MAAMKSLEQIEYHTPSTPRRGGSRARSGHAVRYPELNYSRLLLSKVPEQYDVHSPDLFTKVQAAVDHVASMTDVYALDLYRRLNGQTLPAV